MPVLETPRLRLELLTLDDAAFMLELLNEPSFIQNIGDRGVRTLDQARDYLLRGALASYEQHGYGLYRVDLKTSGEATGLCGLVRRDGLDHADVGFAFFPRFWGQGFAVESAMAVKTWAFDDLGLETLVAITNPENTGSIRVLERIGLAFDRRIRLVEDSEELLLYSSSV